MLVRNDHEICLCPVAPASTDRTSDSARSSAASSAMATPGPTDLLPTTHAFVMSFSLCALKSVSCFNP